MLARLDRSVVLQVVVAVVLAGFSIWAVVFCGGEIVKMHQAQLDNSPTVEQVAPVSEESVHDDDTGSYGPMLRPSGKVGFGTDLGGISISPSGQIGIPLY
jgi:hypothetical protein